MRRLNRTVGLAALVGIVVLLAFRLAPLSRTDPDRYYHFAIDRLEAADGTLHALPQADDLGWGAGFTDKEYLFHLIGRALYRLGGENAVAAMAPALAAAVIGGLYWLASDALAPLAAGAVTVFFTFLCPHFYYRMLFLRPHLLAVALFVLALGAVTRRNAVVFGVACLLYALAYHALFVPAALLAGCVAMGLRGRRDWSRLSVGGLAGLLIGIVINPYFPKNVEMMFSIVGIATDNELNFILQAGRELFPLPLGDYVRCYWLHLVIAGLGAGLGLFAASAGRAVGDGGKPDATADELLFLAVMALAFTALTGISPRATEYATPLVVLVAARVLAWSGRRRFEWKVRFGAPAVLAAVFLATEAVAFPATYSTLFGTPLGPSQASFAFEALQALPAGARGAKVYHCEWSLGSYILDARPDLRFIDLLDPRFLFEADPEFALRRARFNLPGGGPGAQDAAALIVGRFHADYVLCANRDAVTRLDRDDRFQRVFPASASAELAAPAYAPVLYAVTAAAKQRTKGRGRK